MTYIVLSGALNSTHSLTPPFFILDASALTVFYLLDVLSRVPCVILLWHLYRPCYMSWMNYMWINEWITLDKNTKRESHHGDRPCVMCTTQSLGESYTKAHKLLTYLWFSFCIGAKVRKSVQYIMLRGIPKVQWHHYRNRPLYWRCT